MTTATVTVNLADADDGTTVYLKYGPVNEYSTNPKPPAYNVYGKKRGEEQVKTIHGCMLTKHAPLQWKTLPSMAPPRSICQPQLPLAPLDELGSSGPVVLL